jgi:hypothetical protein
MVVVTRSCMIGGFVGLFSEVGMLHMLEFWCIYLCLCVGHDCCMPISQSHTATLYC